MHIENVLRASCIIWVSVSSSIIMTTTTEESEALQPYFDFDVPRNLTVTVGQTGFLHCRVERLGDQDVAWIRQRDLHILTMGASTYTSDQRFQVIRPEGSVNWTLQIKYPQTRDSGVYECQINTEPKMSLSYVLNVIGNTLVEPLAQENDIHSGDRGRITIETDWTDALTSRLKIKRAIQGDTGNYTCVPTMARSASVYAHVISGEHPAAMQHNAAPSTVGHRTLRRSMCILLLLHLATLLYLLSDRCCSRRSGGQRNILQRPTASHRSARGAASGRRCETIVFSTHPS
ncbi:zwei Ig domain protein zig-8 isoform X2 [Anopheles gambiae]|uniref:zwei Ig domain protein zig-8 isoform X2 n=1 Tax=Anopheles gambiae TaxID=7165 RepID=UPI002AC8ABD1|nr:zwei Ig domain protein zig-8 isoform X2 [Anopheles gambiae]